MLITIRSFCISGVPGIYRVSVFQIGRSQVWVVGEKLPLGSYLMGVFCI